MGGNLVWSEEKRVGSNPTTLTNNDGDIGVVEASKTVNL